MFRDTFWPGPGQKCLVLPFEAGRSRQKPAQKVIKSGQYVTFLSLFVTKSVLFRHLLSPKVDSGGPTRTFRYGSDGGIDVTFDGNGAFRIPY